MRHALAKVTFLVGVLTTASAEEWLNMQDVAFMLRIWIKEHQDAADKETDAEAKKMQLEVKAGFELLFAFLHQCSCY